MSNGTLPEPKPKSLSRKAYHEQFQSNIPAIYADSTSLFTPHTRRKSYHESRVTMSAIPDILGDTTTVYVPETKIKTSHETRPVDWTPYAVGAAFEATKPKTLRKQVEKFNQDSNVMLMSG